MTMTPLMSLAVLALFALMIPIFTISGSNSETRISSAATPSPSPEAMEMMEK